MGEKDKFALSKSIDKENWLFKCVRDGPYENCVSICTMQHLQFFLLLVIKFVCKEIVMEIEIPQKKLKKQNRI